MTDPGDQSPPSRAPWIVMFIGLAVVLVSIFADSIGLSGGGHGFGWKQLLATIVGLVIMVSGVGLMLRDRQFPGV
jgi:hypothetical protein